MNAIQLDLFTGLTIDSPMNPETEPREQESTVHITNPCIGCDLKEWCSDDDCGKKGSFHRQAVLSSQNQARIHNDDPGDGGKTPCWIGLHADGAYGNDTVAFFGQRYRSGSGSLPCQDFPPDCECQTAEGRREGILAGDFKACLAKDDAHRERLSRSGDGCLAGCAPVLVPSGNGGRG